MKEHGIDYNDDAGSPQTIEFFGEEADSRSVKSEKQEKVTKSGCSPPSNWMELMDKGKE